MADSTLKGLLDKLTLPEYLEVAPCERMGHAGRDYSQFAELRGGTLWRSDFVLRQKAAPKGDVQMEFKSALLPDQNGEGMAAHEAVIRVTGVTVGNARAMVMLPGNRWCVMLFSSRMKSIASRFSRPPCWFGTQSPASRE